eukprot:g7672.t1
MRTTFSTIALCLVLCVAASHAARVDRRLTQTPSSSPSTGSSSTPGRFRPAEQAFEEVEAAFQAYVDSENSGSSVDARRQVFLDAIELALENLYVRGGDAYRTVPPVSFCRGEFIDNFVLAPFFEGIIVRPFSRFSSARIPFNIQGPVFSALDAVSETWCLEGMNETISQIISRTSHADAILQALVPFLDAL